MGVVRAAAEDRTCHVLVRLDRHGDARGRRDHRGLAGINPIAQPMASIWPALALVVGIVSIVTFVGWYWFEWNGTLAIGIPAAVAIVLAMPAMPDRLVLNFVWLVPIAMLILQIYVVRDYFLR
jgi:hypothetical protein